MINKSILIFGAGKIGRSFIGQIFSRSGYEVIFCDVDPYLVENLNKRKCYPVIIKSEKEERLLINNIRAIHWKDDEEVIREIGNCTIMATCVGKGVIDGLIAKLAKGILKRFEANPEDTLDIILAENMRDASEYVAEELKIYLPFDFPFARVGLVETSIGKMVPVMTRKEIEEDPLVVFAEPYNKLVLDRKAFKGEIPDVMEFALKDNIKAWVDRKAFIHNLGHATAAYFGYYKHPDLKYISEVLQDKDVVNFTRKVMIQSAKIIEKLYPEDFTIDELTTYIDDLLKRFQNRHLQDTLFRVGQDRIRKLSPNDRFVGIIRLAIKMSMRYDYILKAMIYAFHFQATDENGNRSVADIHFDNFLSQGIVFVLQRVCGFNPLQDGRFIRQFNKYYADTKKIDVLL